MKELEVWCQERGIKVNCEQLSQFAAFKDNLLDWNQRINLTAIVDDEGIWQKHFADSLTLLPLISGAIRMIDVGCGAGFPSLPIKIMRPDINMTLIDSLRKRIFFLQDTINLLGLKNVECIHSRAEDLAKQDNHRGCYDICTARAVARLDKLCKWCLPFIKPGGLFLAMKGPDVDAEVKEALPVIRQMGCDILRVEQMEIIPGLVHSVVVCYNVID